MVLGVSLAVGLFALVALLAGPLGLAWMLQVRPGFVPMAPMTAWLLLLLAGALLLSVAGRRIRHWDRSFILLASLTLLGALAVVVLRAAGLESTGGGRPLPTAAVSALTGIALLLSASAALLGGPEPAAVRGRRQGAAVLALASLGCGVLVLISYAAGLPLLYGSRQVPMALPTAAAVSLLGLALLLRNGPDVWPLSLFAVRERSRDGSTHARVLRLPSGLFTLLALGLLAGGALLIRGRVEAERRAVVANLRAIAELKTGQIARWREDLQAKNSVLNGSVLPHRLLIRFMEGRRGEASRPEIQAFLASMKGRNFARVDAFDRTGQLRASSDSIEADPFDPQDRFLEEVLRAAGPVFKDLHLDEPSGQPRLDLWVPLREGPGLPVGGAIRFQVDPAHFLLPLIQSWPGSSPSAETLLVRREGGDVLFLNELRHQPGAALRMRRSIAEHPELPASQAAAGRTGLTAGRDYRGVPVLGWVAAVPDSDWMLVAKQDAAEVYGPIQRDLWSMTLALLGAIAAAASATGNWVRQRDAATAAAQLTLERERNELAQRFRQLMDQARDLILIADPDGRIREANAAACAAYGRSAVALAQLRLDDLADPAAADQQRQDLARLRAEGEGRFETVHLGAGARPFPLEVNARWITIEGQLSLLAFLRDITERRRQEQRILRLTQLYAALSQVNQAITREHTRQSILDKVCELMVGFGGFRLAWVAWAEAGATEVACAAHHGDDQGYLQAITVRAGTPEARGPVGEAITANRPAVFNDFAVSPESAPWHAEARRCGYGSAAAFPIHCEGRVCGALAVYAAEPGFFGDEEVALLAETAGDLSFALDHILEEQARGAAEEALQSSERFLREAQEAGQLGTYEWDLRTDCWKSSESMDQIFGIGPDYVRDLAGWLALVAPAHREAMQAYVAGTIAARGSFDHVYPILRPADGRERWVYGRGQFEWDAEGNPLRLSGTIQDITERREAEERQRLMEAQLAQAQKLESLGKLAGGVAHDMNNVLGAILSLATTHRARLADDAPLAKALDTINNACLRGRGVVKGLLYFAHRDLEEERVLDLNGLVTETVNLLAYTTLKKVRLELDLEEDLPPILGDAGAISHSLMNLCVNAVDAMEGTGTISIRTCRLSDGSFRVSVRDTGPGMTEEVRAKAMEPFFTTKPVGKGTGLGLSMAFGTLKAHEGSLEILSAPGEGTEIRMVFPASRAAEPAPAPPPVAGPEGTATATGMRILLVDDDELIRESVGPMLGVMGHAVRSASGGEEALQIVADGFDPELVLLDMNMPGMNGAATLERLLARRPQQRVLLATGYSDQDLGGLLEGRPRVGSIRKPFSLEELRARLASLPGPLPERPRD